MKQFVSSERNLFLNKNSQLAKLMVLRRSFCPVYLAEVGLMFRWVVYGI